MVYLLAGRPAFFDAPTLARGRTGGVDVTGHFNGKSLPRLSSLKKLVVRRASETDRTVCRPAAIMRLIFGFPLHPQLTRSACVLFFSRDSAGRMPYIHATCEHVRILPLLDPKTDRNGSGRARRLQFPAASGGGGGGGVKKGRLAPFAFLSLSLYQSVHLSQDALSLTASFELILAQMFSSQIRSLG